MSDLPVCVQVGPYTYCLVRHSKTENSTDSFSNQANQTISLAATLPPQREAAGLIRAVCQIIFEMMGNDLEESIALARVFGDTFSSTLGASPEAFAWAMAGLLEDREDRKQRAKEVRLGDDGYGIPKDAAEPHDWNLNDPKPPFYSQPRKPIVSEAEREADNRLGNV
jgi:hypothetical protein